MDILLSVVNVLLIFVLAGMIAVVLKQPRSRAQISFALFAAFVSVFVLGLELELLHSQTTDAALSALAVQYFGQCGFLVALLLFANEFIDMKVPAPVFVIQGMMSVITMFGILTAGMNKLFYTSMKIVHEGMYTRMECGDGILWYLYYIYFFSVFLYIIVFCIRQYRVSNAIHKSRIIYMMTGLSILIIELLLKGAGIFGSYNPVSIALTGMVLCLMMGVVKEGYLDSIDATIENVLNHGDEGLIVLDAWSRIIFANEQAKQLFPDIKTGYALSAQGSLKEAMNQNEEYLHINNAVYEARREAIIESDVKTGDMIYFINVTELVHQSEELKAVNEERVRFMTKASHELRSPLNVALGADEMILRESHDPVIREYAGMIKEDIGSIVSLVEDIINTSLAEQNMLSIKEEDFSLNDLLKHLDAVYQGKAEDKKLHFSLDFDGTNIEEHEDVLLKGDRKRLSQILINLLDNAVKYTDQGEFSLHVMEKSLNDDRADISFSVSDTGEGIPESEQQIIFQKYTRGKEAEASKEEGLGLGLSIVKTFVDAMQGTIHLESAPGKGSIFTVHIPFKRSIVNKQEEKEETETLLFTGKKILVVDDRPSNIMIMRHQLKNSGLSVDEANDGMHAVTMCEKQSYDALIIDYMMPGMDGIETLNTIQKDEKGKNRTTYAIVFSANVTPDAEKMYHEAGFSDFLTKPVYYKELVKTLERAFNISLDESDQVINRLEKAGVDTRLGMEYSDDDKDFYLELLHTFVKGYDQERSEFLSMYENVKSDVNTTENGYDSWKEFTRIAHGFKGELRSFGDQAGADMFYALENYGKSEDKEGIEKALPEALEHLDDFVRAVNGIEG